MTEQVHFRIRTSEGAYVIISPTDVDDFDIVVLGEGRRALDEEAEELALAFALRITSQIRSQLYKKLLEIRANNPQTR